MENHVGCYETGSLDFFGPLCVVACYVDQKDEFWLNKLNLEVTSNKEIIQLGKVLKEKLTYSLLLLDNSHYNQYVSEGQKLSCMKANLYNQAMINVIQRIMMCAKILSQYAYLQYYQNMCDSLEITLPRGFNILANDAGCLLVKKYGQDILEKVSKTNFPNYKQILERV